MVMELKNNTELQDKFAQANPNPVLSSAADGALRFVNPAALKLMHDLGLEHVEDCLPEDHKSLVKACLNTGVTLTEECHMSGRIIVWSYRSSGEGDVVYIYGHDVSVYQSKSYSPTDLPEENPNPVLTYNVEGKIQFANIAVTLLLNKLGQENVEDMLPVNHVELVAACFKTGLPAIEERQTGNRIIVWSYRLPLDGEVINIYGYDVTNNQPKGLGVNGLPGVNPSPVLTSNLNGVLQYINHAASQLLMVLGMDNIEDILPQDHKGMVKACHSTNTPLTERHQVGGETLVWSYIPVDASDVIYIYGYDITDYCSGEPVEKD